MLKRLIIRDFVLVQYTELVFTDGLLVLTGETGAGKSLIVDALSVLLGGRADASLVRDGAEQAELCAEFSVAAQPYLQAWLREHDLADPDDVDHLLIRRILDAKGRSRAYLNASPCLLQQLRHVGESLVDICGQHAHQSLLRVDAQRMLFDRYAGLTTLAGKTQQAWRQYRVAIDALEQGKQAQVRLSARREQLTWLVDELGELALEEGTWITLNAEQGRLANQHILQAGVSSVLASLQNDDGIRDLLGGVERQLASLASLDASLSESEELIKTAIIALDELLPVLRHYRDHFDANPDRLAELDKAIERIVRVARKYRLQPENIPSSLIDARAELADLERLADLLQLEHDAAEYYRQWRALAENLKDNRREAAPLWVRAVQAQIAELGLATARFDLALTPIEGGESGLENISFLFAANPGTPLKPLAKVVSGGELSRIALAVQVVAAADLSLPTLIFDEVDVGIAGVTAAVVGKLLRRLGEKRQLICVTHQPQVAAAGHHHWCVGKHVIDNRALSTITVLSADERVHEIARILCGSTPTETAQQHARALLTAASDHSA